MLEKGMEKREPAYNVCGNVSWCSQNSIEVPQKTKNRVAIWPSRTSQVAQWVKWSAGCAGDKGHAGSVPGWGRPPGGGHGNPPQYSCLENPIPEEPGYLQSMVLQRLRHDWSECTHACVWPKQSYSWADTCTPFFIAALFPKAKTWKQPKCPLTDEWIMKMCTQTHTHSGIVCSSEKE